jgi:hypothetical protein
VIRVAEQLDRSRRVAGAVARRQVPASGYSMSKPFSCPNLRAGVLARAVPTSARAPTMAHARRRSPSSLGAAMKHR